MEKGIRGMQKGSGTAAAPPPVPREKQPPFVGRLIGPVIVGMLRLLNILPWRMRLTVADFVMAWIFAPLAGYRGRIRRNLAHVCPDLDPGEVRRLCRRVPGNVGRFLVESTSVDDLRAHVCPLALSGDGVKTLLATLDAGKPVIMTGSHFGNFNVVRLALTERGYTVGGLYRPHDDPWTNVHYRAMLAGFGEPNFARGRRGMGAMLKFLREGNIVGILVDQHVRDGAPLTFFGQPASTTLSAAKLALKYEAALIPAYALRRGTGFEIVIEAPIARGAPDVMMQAINDSIEARVRHDMDQWLWIHRRWKLSGL